MKTDLKAYVIATESNLALLRDKLIPKYKTLSITGTNSMEEGIRNVIDKHVLHSYDVLIIVPQNFVLQDAQLKHELSNMINTAVKYSARDLPIYFFCKKDNIEYKDNLKKLLPSNNIRIYPYSTLNLADFEQVIKEVATFRARKSSSIDHSTEKDIIEQKMKAYRGGRNNYLERIFTRREEEGDESFSRMRRVKDIISNNSRINIPEEEKAYNSPTAVLTGMKEHLFNRSEVASEEVHIISTGNINEALIKEQLNPEVASTKLREVSIEYDDYLNYMSDIEDVITQIKESDREDKAELVLELMQERSLTHKNAHLILADFITKVAETSVQHITDTIENDLKKFSEINDVDQLVGGKLKEIEILKDNRERFKNELQSITERMYQLSTIVRESLTDMGNQYRITNEQMRQDIINHANEHGIVVAQNQLVPLDKRVMHQLQESYNFVNKNVNGLINVSHATVENFVKLVQKDEEIMERQGEAIDILMTQKTKKIIVLDNAIQVKSFAFMGVDGTGKTHSAYSFATALSKHRKVILIDLNLANPSLKYYNKTRDSHGSHWLNTQTIQFENFIKLPISNKLSSQLPFSDGLTIIQPSEKIMDIEHQLGINPKLVVNQVTELLKQVIDFYDNVVFILPQDVSIIEDIFKHVGKLFFTSDVNPNTFSLTKTITDTHNESLTKVPVKFLLINKLGKGMALTADFITSNIGISLTDYAYLKVPYFNDSPLMKLEGKNPYKESAVIGRYFSEIVKSI